MYSDLLKTGARWAGLGIAVYVLGMSLHGMLVQVLPELLKPLCVSGNAQIDMLNTIWRCLG